MKKTKLKITLLHIEHKNNVNICNKENGQQKNQTIFCNLPEFSRNFQKTKSIKKYHIIKVWKIYRGPVFRIIENNQFIQYYIHIYDISSKKAQLKFKLKLVTTYSSSFENQLSIFSIHVQNETII